MKAHLSESLKLETKCQASVGVNGLFRLQQRHQDLGAVVVDLARQAVWEALALAHDVAIEAAQGELPREAQLALSEERLAGEVPRLRMVQVRVEDTCAVVLEAAPEALPPTAATLPHAAIEASELDEVLSTPTN